MKSLVDSTISGQCKWEEKCSSIVSGVRRKNYTVIFDSLNFKLQATSTRNADAGGSGGVTIPDDGYDDEDFIMPKTETSN